MDVINVTADAEEFTCNAYLLTGERPTLVDAGSMPGVESVVADHVDRLDRVVLTHQHQDHVGELDAVLDAFDAELYAYGDHPRRTDGLSDGDAVSMGDESFDAELYAYGDHPRRTDGLSDGDAVSMGDESFDVVYTPGHADDHVSLVSDHTLFSGDVVVYNDGAFEDGSFGRTDMPGQSRARLIGSLETLLARLPDSVESMYAGHGDPFHADDESVRDVIERALSRAERREPKY